jgi:hypothetical protein
MSLQEYILIIEFIAVVLTIAYKLFFQITICVVCKKLKMNFKFKKFKVPYYENSKKRIYHIQICRVCCDRYKIDKLRTVNNVLSKII